MFTKVSHTDGIASDDEILFSTPFGYIFPEAARSRLCLLPVTEATQNGLRALGAAMADNGTPASPGAGSDSNIPAIFTYFGQFIDHDITARTDRDGVLSELGRGEPVVPLDPDTVITSMRNGRRPQLDLDSVFGEGPAFVGASESQTLYDSAFKLKVFRTPERVDVPREPNLRAIISDMRNDENVNISQLQAAFLNFYNEVYDVQSGTNAERHVRARQLVRWAYQYAVVHDYLPAVCDVGVVHDTLANGPRFLGSTAGKGDAFMPLEFSVAAFRFGHSMIRPFYKLNAVSTAVNLLDLLGPSAKASNFSGGQLKPELVVDFSNFVGPAAQKARRLDPKIAHDLFNLPFRPDDPVLSHLARSNLLRGYNLSIPTGQAMCDGFGLTPLTPAELTSGEDPTIASILTSAYFHHRTPLWYYVLREAAVQQSGQRLGALGSRIVAETLIGLLKQDPNSYLSNRHDAAVKNNGIDVKPGAGGVIKNLHDLLRFAKYPL